MFFQNASRHFHHRKNTVNTVKSESASKTESGTEGMQLIINTLSIFPPSPKLDVHVRPDCWKSQRMRRERKCDDRRRVTAFTEAGAPHKFMCPTYRNARERMRWRWEEKNKRKWPQKKVYSQPLSTIVSFMSNIAFYKQFLQKHSSIKTKLAPRSSPRVIKEQPMTNKMLLMVMFLSRCVQYLTHITNVAENQR